MPRLEIDTDGDVFLVEPEGEDADGRVRLLGFVLEDWRCPSGREDEWAALASRWMETCREGRDVLALWRNEYEASLGALQWA